MQSRAPKSFDIRYELLEGFASDDIIALRSDPAFVEKAGLAQYSVVA